MNVITLLAVEVAVGFLALASFSLATGIWKRTEIGRKLVKRKKRSPLPDNMRMLRPAGHGLRQKVNDLSDNLMFFAMMCILGPLGGLIFLAFAGSRSLAAIAIVFCPVFIAGLILSARTTRTLQEYRLGLDGELATAEELNRLMRQGYHVFHDFPATDKFNIDHILVGPAGVLAVETKMRSKRSHPGKEGSEVTLEGSILRFPGFEDRKSMRQAREQAKWLGGFLSKSVGKNIPVNAVVALPGWYVKREKHDGSVLVYNPTNGDKLITNRPTILDDQTIQQVAYQIEQRCRDREPYSPV